MAWLSRIFVAVAMLLGCINAYAVPRIALEKHISSIDLRDQWEFALVGVPEQGNDQTFDPQDVWQWGDERFSSPNLKNQHIVLNGAQRFIARLELASSDTGDGVYLLFKVPRLDAVHVFYRYGDEPWTKESAGDTLAMNTWPFFERQPAFDLPQRQGTLSLVIEMAHVGVMDAPIMLENSSTFRLEGLTKSLVTGLAIGINLVLAVVGLMAALNFRRWNFLGLSVMALLMAAVIFTNSGLAGMYILTQSTQFNDQSKFLTGALWCVMFPVISAMSLSLRNYSRWWWRVSMVWAGMGIALTVYLMPYAQRALTLKIGPLLAAACIGLALTMLANALLHKRARVMSTMGIVLYALAFLMPQAAHYGLLQNDHAIGIEFAMSLIATLMFYQTLVTLNRQGHMVMARAKTSAGRDVLTGLLSRQGFEHMLAKNVNRMFVEKTYAAFFYIAVSDAKTLHENYGDEGFEVGMVQLAAAVSSSLSAVDTVGRVAPNAFAVTVMMPRNAKLANAQAQKIITRALALATHSTPMAQTVRVAVAWLPVFGTLLPDIERRTLRTLQQMDTDKRIAWVGGAYAQMEVSQMPNGLSNPTTKPTNGPSSDDDLPSLPGVINRLEREMLGPDSEQLEAEAARLMRVMKQSIVSDGFANTRIESRESAAVK